MKKIIFLTILSISSIAFASDRVVLEDLTPEENKTQGVLPEYKILEEIRQAHIESQSRQVKNIVLNNNNAPSSNQADIKTNDNKKEITVEQKKEIIKSVKQELIEESNKQKGKEKEKSKEKENKVVEIKESDSCFPGQKNIEGSGLKINYLDNCIKLIVKGNSNTIQIRGSKNIIVEGSGNTILVKEDIENGIHILGKNNKLIMQSVSSIIVDGDNNTIKWKENKDNKQPRIRLIGVNNVAELNISN